MRFAIKQKKIHFQKKKNMNVSWWTDQVTEGKAELMMGEGQINEAFLQL